MPGQAKSESALASGPDPSHARAVFFDAVGTLIFTAEPVAVTYRTIARRHGIEIDAALISRRFRDAFRIEEEKDQRSGWRTDEERERQRWRSIVSATLCEVADLEACFGELWNHFSSPAAWSVNPEARTILSELSRRGLIVGIASNFDARLLGIVRAHSALVPAAERCVVSSLVGWRKPATGFFEELSRRAGCAAGEVLLVGDDWRNDYQAARAAGMQAVLYGADGNSEIDDRIASLSDVLTPPAPPLAARGR
jgi:putative hydrolase of the HAD superfamily